MKKIISLMLLSLSLLIGQSVVACPAGKDSKNCHCAKQHQNKMSEALHLTDDQKVKIQDIRSKTHQAIQSDMQQLKGIRHQINQLVTSDNFEEKQLDDLISQRNKIKGEIFKATLMMRHQIYALLNDQQKVQFQKMMTKHHNKQQKHD